MRRCVRSSRRDSWYPTICVAPSLNRWQPSCGAKLLATALSTGWRMTSLARLIGNVIVMAGVPSIMQAMLDEVAPKLKVGVRMLSETVRANAREGDIGMQLGEIAKANPGVAIGSYPFFDPQHGPNTNVVLRARNAHRLAQAKRAVEEMLERVRRAQSSS